MKQEGRGGGREGEEGKERKGGRVHEQTSDHGFISHHGTCSSSVFFHIHTVHFNYVQVNKKFQKYERVYRDCIKRTRDKTRIHCIPHDAPGT